MSILNKIFAKLVGVESAEDKAFDKVFGEEMKELGEQGKAQHDYEQGKTTEEIEKEEEVLREAIDSINKKEATQ